jgi:hypothetical protein
MSDILVIEEKTFDDKRAELLGKARGKFVLVHDTEIAGIYESKADAVEQGYQRFGNVPFLVKQILDIDVMHNFVSNHLAL